jgi:hypothetical protein
MIVGTIESSAWIGSKLGISHWPAPGEQHRQNNHERCEAYQRCRAEKRSVIRHSVPCSFTASRAIEIKVAECALLFRPTAPRNDLHLGNYVANTRLRLKPGARTSSARSARSRIRLHATSAARRAKRGCQKNADYCVSARGQRPVERSPDIVNLPAIAGHVVDRQA